MSGKTISELYVLLVEPSHAQAKYIRKELQKAGVTHLEVVEDGSSALAAMGQYHPDLVVSAMYFPDMTGSELVQTMRESEDLHDIAFMLISSETSFEYLDPVRQAGVTAILPKPFEFHQLKRGLINTIAMLNPELLELDDFEIEDLKVLVVDDSSTARKHIKRVLTGMGIESIMEADDGATAVPLIDEHFFDLVVTDYNMPEMDGKALLEYIRGDSNQRSIPVLMVTSEGNKGILAAVAQAGVSGICDKPFETDSVRNLIKTMMTEV